MGLFTKPDAHSVLLIDIASSSIGVGISGIKENALPELVFTLRVPFAYKHDFDLAHIEHAMLYALKDALGVALREGSGFLKKTGYPGTINHAVISLSSPWHATEIGKDHAGFKKRLEERFNTPMEVFESEHGHMTAAEKRLVKKVEDEVIRIFGIKEGVELSSFNFTFSRVITHAFQDIEPVMFVDMTGHNTDIISMMHGTYHANFSIPAGTHTLKRQAGVPWDTFWKQVSGEHDTAFEYGNIFLIADEYDLGKKYLQRVLPNARIISFGASRGFIDEMVKAQSSLASIERIAVLATYSNLFL